MAYTLGPAPRRPRCSRDWRRHRRICRKRDETTAVKLSRPPERRFRLRFRKDAQRSNIHRLVTRDRVQRSLHRPESLTRNNSLLHQAMILLDDVVHVRRGSTKAVPAQLTSSLQLADVGRICRVTIDVDHSRAALARKASCRNPFAAIRSRWATAEIQSCSQPNRRPDINRSTCRRPGHKFHPHVMTGSDCASPAESVHSGPHSGAPNFRGMPSPKPFRPHILHPLTLPDGPRRFATLPYTGPPF